MKATTPFIDVTQISSNLGLIPWDGKMALAYQTQPIQTEKTGSIAGTRAYSDETRELHDNIGWFWINLDKFRGAFKKKPVKK